MSNHTYTKKIGGDSIDLFLVFQVEREIVMTGAIFMMQISHAVMQMQRLSMMVPAHVFTCDANVSLQRWRCKMSCGANAF